MGFMDLLEKGMNVVDKGLKVANEKAQEKKAVYDRNAKRYYEKYGDDPEKIKKDYKDGKIKGEEARYAAYAYKNMTGKE